MKKKLFIIFLFSSGIAFSQSRYLVYQLRGNIQEISNKGSKRPRIGELLENNAVVWLDKGAGLTLICENYAIFSVNTPGKFILKEHQACPQQAHSLTTDYFKFIWEELTHPHETPEDDRRKFMHNTGAVIRGCPGILTDHLFDTFNYYREAFSISWKTNMTSERLSFVLYEDEKDGEQIFAIPVKENSISVDDIKKHSQGHNEVYWGINVDGNEICPRKYIRFWSTDQFDLYIDSLKKLIPQVVDKAESEYMMGFMLEAGSFTAEALYHYQQAVAADPASTRYRLTLADVKKKLN